MKDRAQTAYESCLQDPNCTLREPEDSVACDWLKLEDYLQARGHDLALHCPPRQFAGGLANINYLVIVDGKPAVLRRPPEGPLPPGAHDMGREHKILSRLHSELALAPRSYVYCDDPGIIGVPFQILEYRCGLIVRNTLSEPLGSTAPAALSQALTETLARIHRVDVAKVGLDTLGKPEGFVERGVRGWTRRAEACYSGNMPACAQAVSTWLAGNMPDDFASPTLIHNDVKLDNIIFEPGTLNPAAVLDWDMGTLGHPLFDLATTLSYWTEPGDPECLQQLKQMPTTAPGFWSRGQAVEHYQKTTGADVSDLPFFRALAYFKLGVVFKQLEQRKSARGGDDPRNLDALGESIIEFTAESLTHNALA